MPGFSIQVLCRWFALAGIVAAFVWPSGACAEAFRILDQSASATGQGTAFSAQADDPSAIHYNPAGMTQLRGIQASIGTNFVSADVSFTNAMGVKTEGAFGGTVANPPPSNFFVTANLAALGFASLDFATVGLGVTSPFGISVEYPQSSSLSTVVTRAELPLIDIKPTLAFKLSEQLAVGAGLDIYTFTGLLGEGQAETQRIAGPEFGSLQGRRLELNAKDSAVGVNVSLLVTALRNAAGKPVLNLAFIYRNQVTLNLDGQILTNGGLLTNATAELDLPQVVSGGIALWPIRGPKREWKLEVDMDYVDWNAFKDLNVQRADGGLLPPGFGTRDYNQAYVVMFGTEYKWLDIPSLPFWEVAFRGGYVYSQTPVPEFTFDPSVPDANYHAFSVGLGLLCGESGTVLGLLHCHNWAHSQAIGIDLAYQVLLYQSRAVGAHIRSNLGFPSEVIGTWDTTVHVGSVNFRINFSS